MSQENLSHIIAHNKAIENYVHQHNLNLGTKLVATYCNYTPNQILDPKIFGSSKNEVCPACKGRFNIDIRVDEHTANIFKIWSRINGTKGKPIYMPPKDLITKKYDNLPKLKKLN
jgi:hypothetical protein